MPGDVAIQCKVARRLLEVRLALLKEVLRCMKAVCKGCLAPWQLTGLWQPWQLKAAEAYSFKLLSRSKLQVLYRAQKNRILVEMLSMDTAAVRPPDTQPAVSCRPCPFLRPLQHGPRCSLCVVLHTP